MRCLLQDTGVRWGKLAGAGEAFVAVLSSALEAALGRLRAALAASGAGRAQQAEYDEEQGEPFLVRVVVWWWCWVWVAVVQKWVQGCVQGPCRRLHRAGRRQWGRAQQVQCCNELNVLGCALVAWAWIAKVTGPP